MGGGTRLTASSARRSMPRGERLALVIPPAREEERDVGDMALYAGSGVGEVAEVEPARDVVADLVRLL